VKIIAPLKSSRSSSLFSWVFVAVVLSLTMARPAAAIVISFGEQEMDLAAKAGVMTGTISSQANKSAGKQAFGGAVLGLSFGFDHTQKWSTFVTPEAAIDASSRAVIRKGAQAGLLYHLSGGAKKTKTFLYNAEMTHTYSHSFALVLKSSYFEYTVRDAEERLEPIRGTVIENSAGFDARLDISEINSYGTQLTYSFLTMPTGVEGLSTSILELGFYWRRYF